MRQSFSLFAALLVCLGSVTSALGQDAAKASPETASPETPAVVPDLATARSYSVEIVEFEIEESDGAALSPSELIQAYAQMKRDGKLKRAETIRFTALEQRASIAKFGKQVSLTVGSQMGVPGRPALRHVKAFEIGTEAEVEIANSSDDRVSLDLAYRSSRVEGEGTEDSPPDIVSINIETTLILELGKAKLLGGTSQAPNAYVLVTVSE